MVRFVDVAVTPAAISVCPTPVSVAVVVDVLRATSTIVTALENGAAGVVPVRDTDEAITVMRRLGRERTLLCGERNARLIPGFDLDNSPASYGTDAVAGKTLVFTTTNGTRALVDAGRDAAAVWCGAMLNRAAVVERLIQGQADDVLIVCAGDAGAVSFDDLLGAGAIVSALAAARPGLERSDAARAAGALFEAYQRRLTTALASGTHARALRDAGFAEDVVRCSQLDVSAIVPVYADGVIAAG